MKNPEQVAVIVQARLSSERVPQKMIRPFAGTNLVQICIDKVKASKIPRENFYFAAHEPELVDIAYRNNLCVFHRSERSAKSEGTPLTDIYEWHDKLAPQFTHCIMINACCTLLDVETINNFWDVYLQSKADGYSE